MKSTKMNSIEVMAQLVFDYRSEEIGLSRIVHADCFEWLSRIPENSIHAIVTDPPYGVKENAFLSQLVFSALVDGGLEFRGELIRVVLTLRCGDRPKNAEEEFPGVSSLSRGCYEPWGILRKPMLPGMKLSDCLQEFQTGGLRRTPDDKPFSDVFSSERTPQPERDIADHPSLKPQSFLRQVVHAALPLGEGIIVDPFMGSGSTVAKLWLYR
jgi:site-specific DNA-methyltransferase (adenine-specific)